MGWLDENNRLHISNRQDEMIIRAGINIYPQEIECVLRKYKGIKEVSVYVDKTKEITQENAKHGGKVTIQSNVKAQELCEPLKTELFHFEEN